MCSYSTIMASELVAVTSADRHALKLHLSSRRVFNFNVNSQKSQQLKKHTTITLKQFAIIYNLVEHISSLVLIQQNFTVTLSSEYHGIDLKVLMQYSTPTFYISNSSINTIQIIFIAY